MRTPREVGSFMLLRFSELISVAGILGQDMIVRRDLAVHRLRENSPRKSSNNCFRVCDASWAEELY